MNKGDIANVIAQDGDWIQVQNYWDSKPVAWLMYQNKKGKQLAEAAPDQVMPTIHKFITNCYFTLRYDWNSSQLTIAKTGRREHQVDGAATGAH